jgi:hypothetical protein
MRKLVAFLIVLALSVPALAAWSEEDGPPRLRPRALHRRLLRDPIDPRAAALVRHGFSLPRPIDVPLSQAEAGAGVVGRVVVKVDGPFSDSLFGYQVFSDAAAARRAYAATTVAARPDVRLVAATTAELDAVADRDAGGDRIECEHFVRSGKPDGLTQCRYLVRDAHVIVFSALGEAGQTGAVSDERRDGAAQLVRAAVAHGRARGYWRGE